MSVKDLIKSAFDKDASSFETTFNSVMDEKMETALAAKYDEMFSVDEEVEVEEEFDSEESVEEGYKKKMKEEDDEDEDDDDEEDEDDDDEEEDED